MNINNSPFIIYYQGFSNFLLDSLLVTKFNLHSSLNKLITYQITKPK